VIYRTVTNADYRRVDRGHWMLDGCHLWLPMQDAAGGMCYDWSGKGHHGTLTGMDPATDWTTGKLGRALDFDGSNDSVNVGNIVEPAGGTGYTFTAWVRRRAVAPMHCLASRTIMFAGTLCIFGLRGTFV